MSQGWGRERRAQDDPGSCGPPGRVPLLRHFRALGEALDTPQDLLLPSGSVFPLAQRRERPKARCCLLRARNEGDGRLLCQE